MPHPALLLTHRHKFKFVCSIIALGPLSPIREKSINSEILNHKGAIKAQDIPDEVQSLLKKGEIETVNLTEWLAVDHLELLKTAFPKLGMGQDKDEHISMEIKSQKKPSTMNTTKYSIYISRL